MEFKPRDRAIYLPETDALVCADLHVGKDAAPNVELQVGEHEDLTARFEALCTRYEPAEVVIAGDLLHSYSHLPTGSTRTVRTLERIVDEHGARFVVTPGNHDSMLDELFTGAKAPSYRLGTAVITHGHVPPECDADWYVIGHDHPTIEIESRRYPCFLYGVDQYEGSGVLMLPSFSRLPAGVVVNEMSTSEFLSPLVTDLGSLRPIVRDEDADRTHEFPPLGELRRFL